MNETARQAASTPHIVTLTTSGPCDPAYLAEVTEALAESVRVANHLTLDAAALEYPAEVDALIRDVSLAVSRLPQLLRQAAGRLQAMEALGFLRVAGKDPGVTPDEVVARVRAHLDATCAHLEAARLRLEAATRETVNLGANPVPPCDGDLPAEEEAQPRGIVTPHGIAELIPADWTAYQVAEAPEDDDDDRPPV